MIILCGFETFLEVFAVFGGGIIAWVLVVAGVEIVVVVVEAGIL